jgi:hypothetical protein
MVANAQPWGATYSRLTDDRVLTGVHGGTCVGDGMEPGCVAGATLTQTPGDQKCLVNCVKATTQKATNL